MIFLSLLFIVFLTDRVVEDLQELIDDALGNLTVDDLGVAPLAPTGPVNLLPSPSNEVGSTDWSLVSCPSNDCFMFLLLQKILLRHNKTITELVWEGSFTAR